MRQAYFFIAAMFIIFNTYGQEKKEKSLKNGLNKIKETINDAKTEIRDETKKIGTGLKRITEELDFKSSNTKTNDSLRVNKRVEIREEPAPLPTENKEIHSVSSEYLTERRIVSFSQTFGWTPLHEFAKKGQEDSLLKYIKIGYYVNNQTQIINNDNITDDLSPLMLAVEEGHFGVCKKLLLFGADPYLRNSKDNNSFEIANLKGFKEIENLLSETRKNSLDRVNSEFLTYAIEAYRNDSYVVANAYAHASIHQLNIEPLVDKEAYLAASSILSKSYYKMGEFDKAEYWLIEYVSINEKLFGTSSKNHLNALFDQTAFFIGTHQYDKCELSLSIMSKIADAEAYNNTIEKAKIFDSYGNYYSAINNRLEAEIWFEKALALKKKLLGEESYEYGLSLLGVFETQQKSGGLVSTLVESGKVNEIRSTVKTGLGNVLQQHVNLVADQLNDEQKKQAFGEIEKVSDSIIQMSISSVKGKKVLITFSPTSLKKIVEIIKEKDGMLSDNYIQSLALLEYAYQKAGKEDLFQKVHTLQVETKNKQYERKVLFERGLTYLFIDEKVIDNIDKLEELETARIHILKKFGKIDPTYLKVLEKLLVKYEEKNDKKLLSASNEYQLLLNILKTEFTVPYVDASIYLNNLSEIEEKKNKIKEFMVNLCPINDLASQKLYNYVLNEKSQFLNSYRKFLKEDMMEIKSFLDNYDQELKNAGVSRVQLGIGREEHAKTMIGTKIFSKNILKNAEQQIGVKIDGVDGGDGNYKEIEREVKYNWKQIHSKLKEGQVVIEFFYIDHSKTSTKNKTIDYYALIIKPNSKFPELKYLCNGEELQATLKSNSSQINKIYRGVEPEETPNNDVQQRLYKLCWEPLEPFFTSKDSIIFYSPAGLLNQVSFSALPISINNSQSKNNKVLADRYSVNYLSTTLNFLKTTPNSLSINKATSIFLLGNAPTSLPELKSAKAEILSISEIAKKKEAKVLLYEGNDASETNFRKLGSSNKSSVIVHIAAHGSYIEKNSTSESDNPLFRSALYLAGANPQKNKPLENNPDDGILTAFEVSTMNLQNTHLVVLSACETGLGDVLGDEGVFGLQRSFKEAGVEYLLSSLWSVPDKETSELMRLFYENLSSDKLPKISVQKSLENAQKAMREKGYPVYAWGAFVLMR